MVFFAAGPAPEVSGVLKVLNDLEYNKRLEVNILDLERLWINTKYSFSGSTICGDELHAILNKNGIDFEKINNSQIRVFLSK